MDKETKIEKPKSNEQVSSEQTDELSEEELSEVSGGIIIVGGDVLNNSITDENGAAPSVN